MYDNLIVGAVAVLGIAIAIAVGIYLYKENKKMVILVWDATQRVPATCYGDYRFGPGNYKIRVCKNPNNDLKKLGEKRALIYHFS
jgi:hypothetical protein